MSESGSGEPIADFKAALVEFAADLRALYDACGAPSLRDLSKMSRQAGGKLSASGISDALNGIRLPSEKFTCELVGLLTSSAATADPEAVGRWQQRCREMRKLQRAAQMAKRKNPAALNEGPTPPSDDDVAELTELRTLRVRQDALINDLTDQVTGLTRRAVDAETLASTLQQALYTHWPSNGVRLKATHGVNSVAFRPDGRLLTAGYMNGMLRTWNPDSGVKIHETAASNDNPVHCVAYTDNGNVLVTGGGDGTVRLIDPQTGRQLEEPLVRLNESVLAVAFSPRRRQWPSHWQYSLAVGDRSGAVRVWTFSDVPHGDATFTFPADGPVQSLAFLPDRDALAVATEFGRVTVHGYDQFAARDGASVFSDTEDAAVCSLSFASVNGVLVVGDAVGRVHLLRLSADEPFRVEQGGRFDVGFPVQSVASCPVSSLLAIAGAAGVVLRESSSGASTGPSIDGPVRSVAFRADGGLIAVGMADGSTQLHTVAHARSRVTRMTSAAGRRRWRR